MLGLSASKLLMTQGDLFIEQAYRLMDEFVRLIQFSTLQFYLKYRRTRLGSLWVMITPAIFIAFIGGLYSSIAGMDFAAFMPHMTVGYISWTLLGGFITGSTTLIVRYQAFVLQGGAKLEDLVTMEIVSILIIFAHQIFIILCVLWYFKIPQGYFSLVSLLGIALTIVNGRSALIVLGIICLRFRDFQEIINSIVRIAFLATPIIWMAGDDGRGGLIGPYTLYNPFYHFLQIIRAPLLNGTITPLNWYVVSFVTIFGVILSHYFLIRYRKQMPLWI